jgi:hypothetical protein
MTADILLKMTIAAEDAVAQRKTLKEAYVIEQCVPAAVPIVYDPLYGPIHQYDAAPATVYATTDDGIRYRYPMQFVNPANAYVLVRAIEKTGSIDPTRWTPAPLQS